MDLGEMAATSCLQPIAVRKCSRPFPAPPIARPNRHQDCNGSPQQQWKGGGTYQWVSQVSTPNKCIDLWNADPTNGEYLGIWVSEVTLPLLSSSPLGVLILLFFINRTAPEGSSRRPRRHPLPVRRATITSAAGGRARVTNTTTMTGFARIAVQGA